jgi:hypothetical protein
MCSIGWVGDIGYSYYAEIIHSVEVLALGFGCLI